MHTRPTVPPAAVKLAGSELLSWRRRQLQHGGRAGDLDWLLEMAAGLRWPELQGLRLHPEQAVTLSASLQDLERIWNRHRQDQEPLQYLVGLCPWRDLVIDVAPGVLIPRQETELLVELALEVGSEELSSGDHDDGPGLWADLGTGSGCLAMALARAWPQSRGLAVDLSRDALIQARANLRRLQLQQRVEVIEGSWWEPLHRFRGHLDLVVSNPPYIPTATWKELEPIVLRHEPELALHAGEDGLAAIRAIAAEAGQQLAPGGWLLLEHHHDQSAAVLQLLETAGLERVTARRDLEGHERFALARRPR